MAPQGIPNRLVFVWFGTTLPLFAELAVRSAVQHNPEARVVLLHADEALGEQPRLLEGMHCEMRRIAIEGMLERVDPVARAGGQPALHTERLLEIWHALRTPAARSNVVRLLDLYVEGGVYLDTDTLTLKSLAPLRQYPAFCGLEHVLWPWDLGRRAPFDRWIRRPILSSVRALLARLPQGHELSRPMLKWYAQAANNAVLGFQPGHPALHRALVLAALLPKDQWATPFRLGTHLLQQVLSEQPWTEASGVCQLPPEYFFPVGPVMSAAYFRRCADASERTRALTTDNTHVIHWYASVSDLLCWSVQDIDRHADRVVFAHLCHRVLEAQRQRGA